MAIVFTLPAQKIFSAGFKEKISDVYSYFPELQDKQITCGIIKKRGALQGVATSWTKIQAFRLRPNTTSYVIAHELMHLVQGGSSGIPHGEIACDIWTVSRMPLEYLDQIPSYLIRQTKMNWNEKRADVKELCKQAIAIRGSIRTYIRWLQCRIEEL